MEEKLRIDENLKKTLAFYNDNAKRYALAWGSQEPLEDDPEKFVKYVNSIEMITPKQKRILDAGCGHGRDVKFFIEKGFRAYGIDLSEKLLEIAEKDNPDAWFYHSDIRDFTCYDDFFHGIWACGSLLHMPKEDLPEALQNLDGIIKPGGILYLTTKLGEGERLEKKEGWGERFFVYYSRDEILDAVNNKGFKVLEDVVREKPNGKWISVFAEASKLSCKAIAPKE